MTTILGIIQARMGSKRLPGKMLMKLGDEYIIYWVIKRLLRCKKIDQLIVATSKNIIDDDLTKACDKIGIPVFRGSESDVLGRFYELSKEYNSDIIVRICADNPFIDSFEVDKLIDFFVKNKCDYSFNHQNKLNNNYADGFGAEIFTKNTLSYLNSVCKDISIREHVTLHIWKNLDDFNVKYFKAAKELSYPELTFDIDTEQDYEKLSKLISQGVNLRTEASDIIRMHRSLYEKNY